MLLERWRTTQPFELRSLDLFVEWHVTYPSAVVVAELIEEIGYLEQT